MATLTETLRKNKQQSQLTRGADGSLQENSKKDITQLTEQNGLATAPTTAIGAGMLGANPDVQKMMGTPAQLSAALNKKQDTAKPQANLQTALRQQQARTTATAEESQKMQKSKDMEDLGGLGDRVVSFINTQKQLLQAQADNVQTAGAPQAQAQTQFQGQDISRLAPQLEALRNDPTNMQLMLEVQQSLGMDTTKQLDPAQINSLYEDATSTISRQGASVIDDSLNVSNLINDPNFGYSPAQLSELLGLPEANIAGMSVGQLRDQINKTIEQEYNQAQTLQQQAGSTQLGAAERGLARQAGRELSATGVRATEADMQNLQSQIESADVVSFAGKRLKVDELLKDETISGIIKEYLEAGPDSEIRKQVDSSEPALKDFIAKNQAALQDAASQLEAGASEFRKIQEDNKALAKLGTMELDSSIMKALVPGFGSLQAQRVDPASIPFFQYTQGLTDDGKDRVANTLNTAIEADPSIAAELPALNAQELNTLGIGKPGSNFEKLMTQRAARAEIEGIPAGNIDALVMKAYGETPAGFQAKVATANVLNALGLPTGLSIDVTNVGNLKEQMLEATPSVSLQDAAKGVIPTYTQKKLGKPTIPENTTVAGKVYDEVVRNNFGADGQIDAGELTKIVSNFPVDPKTNVQYLIGLEDMANSPKAKIDRAAASAARVASANAYTKGQLAEAVKPGDVFGTVDRTAALLKLDDRMVNKADVRKELQRQILHEGNSPAADPNILAKMATVAMDNGLDPGMIKARFDIWNRDNMVLRGAYGPGVVEIYRRLSKYG
jgi:hypothetical protein